MNGIEQDTRGLRFGEDPEEAALHWLVRLTSGEASDAERQEFERWRADPDHAALYAEVERLWDGMGEVLDPPDNVVPLRPRPCRFAVFGPNWGRQVAAIAASIAVLGFTGQQYASVWQYDHATQGSARGHAELADGSTVALNTGSAIDIAYQGNQRRVTLARGEAFFDVKRDAARPFVVAAGSGEVRVLGTAFSVRREGDGARVTVIRGKVRVSTGDTHVDLLPNQQVSFAGGREGQVARVDAGTLLAWSQGRLVFENKPLASVVAEIDRYYPGMIVLANAKAGRKRVDATVNLDRIDEWLAAMERSQKVTARRLPGVVILS